MKCIQRVHFTIVCVKLSCIASCQLIYNVAPSMPNVYGIDRRSSFQLIAKASDTANTNIFGIRFVQYQGLAKRSN